MTIPEWYLIGAIVTAGWVLTIAHYADNKYKMSVKFFGTLVMSAAWPVTLTVQVVVLLATLLSSFRK